MKPFDLRYYLILDNQYASLDAMLSLAESAKEAGVTICQLRMKACSTKTRIHYATALKPILMQQGIPFIINDDIKAACCVAVDGVHVGQSDGSISQVRRQLGEQAIVGLTIESLAQLDQIQEKSSVSYIGIGPVFSTASKMDAPSALGLTALRCIVEKSIYPSVAIGGITQNNVADVMRTGVDGVAVISAILCAENALFSMKHLGKWIGEACE